MKIKRTISIMLVLAMTLVILPITAQAATDGYYTYSVKNDVAIITDVDESISGDIVIPDKFAVDGVGEYPVVEIGGDAFSDCDNITSVVIPEGVTVIGEYAFYDCNALTDVTIPNTVITISTCAFECSALTSLYVPSSVRTIDGDAFNDCNSLKTVTLSEGLLTLSNGVFLGCDLLEFIKIPSSVEYIGHGAFSSCTNLTEAVIQYGVIGIQWDAFGSCPKLQTITIPDSVTSIDDDTFYDTNPNLIIKCFDGSEAEKHAEEHGFICKYISRDITDPINGVTLSTALETYHAENAIFSASDLEETIEGIEFDHIIYSMAYKIDGNPVALESEMTFSMPIPQGYSGQCCRVYLVENGQKGEQIKTDYLPDEKMLKFSVADPNGTFVIVNEGLPGDATADGVVNLKDVVTVIRYLAGYDVTPDEALADVTGDGTVNLKDVVTLIRYLAGYPVELV